MFQPATFQIIFPVLVEGNGDEGAAFFTIDVDSTTVDEESEVVITLPPDIAGRGFDITAPVYGEKGKFEDVILEIASVGERYSVARRTPSRVPV